MKPRTDIKQDSQEAWKEKRGRESEYNNVIFMTLYALKFSDFIIVLPGFIDVLNYLGTRFSKCFPS